MHTYRRKAITILVSLLVIFFLIAVFSYIQLKREVPILSIGLPYYIEDMVVLILAVLSLLKVVHEIYNIESHKEYEARIKKKIRHK